MAILREDGNGELRRLTNAEIKNQIQQYTGWSDLEYQREYAKFRNRLRNYEATIQQRPTPANEQLYRILQQRATTGQVSVRNQAILNFSSASTRRFKENIQQGNITQKQQNIAINSLVDGVYYGLLFGPKHSKKIKENYDKWLNEVVEIKNEKDPNTGDIIRIEVLRSAKITAQEINNFLKKEAKELHNWQWNEYQANKAMYKNGRAVGSEKYK